MNVTELKAELIEEIKNADEGLLFEIQNVIDQHTTLEIPEYVLKRIKLAQLQAIEGKGIPHEEVIKLSKSWMQR